MGVILGVDQGSTKTAAVVMDMDGSVLGSGHACGSCHAVNGLEHAMSAVMEACKAALAKAGRKLGQVETVSAGMTGADWPEEYILLRDAIHKATGISNVLVYNDCIAALRGGTERPYGAVICAGTGLNVGVRSPGGESWAFGYYIDSEYQGASALGYRALKAVFAAEAGVARPTALTASILGYYREPSVESLLRKFTKAEMAADLGGYSLGSLAPIVLEAAAAGDGTASAIATGFAEGAARFAAAGLQRFGMLDLNPEVVLSGSVFKSRYMRDTTAQVVLVACPGVRVVDALYEPVVGAALLALDERHGEMPVDTIQNNVRRTSAEYGLLRM